MAVQEVPFNVLDLDLKRAREKQNVAVQREAARRQRLENLQKDNHFEDPHKNLVLAKDVPTFDDEADRKQTKKSRKAKLKERWKKTFSQALVEEERYWTTQQAASDFATPTYNYFTAEVGKSSLPPLKLCSICSFPCNMKCVTCEDKFCSKKCLETHKDIRCMKRVV